MLRLPGWMTFGRRRSDAALLTAQLHPKFGNGNGRRLVDEDADEDEQVDDVVAEVNRIVTAQPPQMLYDVIVERLQANERHATRIAKRFKGDFIPLFRDAASLIMRTWRLFESKDCMRFSALRSSLSRTLEGFSPESVAQSYTAEITKVKTTLREKIKRYLHECERKKVEARAEILEYADEQDDLEGQIRRQVIRMCGDPDLMITKPATRQSIALIALFVAVFTVVESASGFNLFEIKGTALGAYGQSGLTVFILTLSALFGARGTKIVLEHHDAMERLKQFKTSPACEDEERSLNLFLLSRTTVLKARMGNGLLALFACSLLAWRVYVTTTDKQATTGLMGAFALLLAAAVFYIFEMWHAPKYEHEHMEKLEDLRAELADNLGEQEDRAQIGEIDPEEISKFGDEFDKAIKNFVDGVQQKMKTAIDERTEYLELDRQYEAAHLEALGYLPILGNLVVEETKRVREHVRPQEAQLNKDAVAEVEQDLRNRMPADLHNAAFNERLTQAVFQVDLQLKDGEKPDFDKWVEEIRCEVRAEVAAASRAQSINVPWGSNGD